MVVESLESVDVRSPSLSRGSQVTTQADLPSPEATGCCRWQVRSLVAGGIARRRKRGIEMKTSPSSHSDDASWSHYPVRDKIVVITGASSGVGFGTSKQLAGQGGEIVMIVRDARTAPKAARLGSA